MVIGNLKLSAKKNLSLNPNSIYSTNYKLSLCGIKFVHSDVMLVLDKR